MSSLRRLLSSRANGRLSRGPGTPAGKQRSAQNALRHGLLAKSIVLPAENEEAFHQLFHQYLERFGPVDGFEFGLIQEMAASYLPLRRPGPSKKPAWPRPPALSRLATTPPASPPPSGNWHPHPRCLCSTATRPVFTLCSSVPSRTSCSSAPREVPKQAVPNQAPAVPNEPSPISGHLVEVPRDLKSESGNQEC